MCSFLNIVVKKIGSAGKAGIEEACRLRSRKQKS
jgi:hypothetical protein